MFECFFFLCSITVKCRLLLFFLTLYLIGKFICLAHFSFRKNALFCVQLWTIGQFEIWDWPGENALECRFRTTVTLLPSFFCIFGQTQFNSTCLCFPNCIELILDCSLQHSSHVRSFVNQKKPKGSVATAAGPLGCWTGWKCCTVPGLNSGFTRKLSMICCSTPAISRHCICYSTCSSCSRCAFYAFV